MIISILYLAPPPSADYPPHKMSPLQLHALFSLFFNKRISISAAHMRTSVGASTGTRVSAHASSTNYNSFCHNTNMFCTAST